MRTSWFVACLGVIGCGVDAREHDGSAVQAVSQAPYGSLDGAGNGIIGGWAYDPDYAGPLIVHIYVDGALVQVAIADSFRPDLTGVCPKTGGHCSFTWDYSHGEGFGPGNFLGTGTHQIVAYAIGVAANGLADGDNPALSGSPKSFTDGCSFLGTSSSAVPWCANPAYWTGRQADTTLLGNPGIRVGVDASYGGTIFQLQSTAQEPALTGHVVWSKNLLAEHGGAALQLSVWGNDAATSQRALCSPGAPRLWNPIQAQGGQCGWDDHSNDVIAACFVANDDPSSVCGSSTGPTYYTKQASPNNFTINDVAVSGLAFEQWVTPFAGYVKIRYRITADPSSFNLAAEGRSPVQWDTRPQEIPALYSNEGINAAFYAYSGAAPFTNAPVTTFGPPSGERFVQLPHAAVYPHAGESVGCASENWWGACNADGTECLTVATFDLVAAEGSIFDSLNPTQSYLAPIGWFGIGSGSTRSWSIYVFPYRYDQIPLTNTLTTRQIIYQLAAAAGVPTTNRTCP